MSKDQTSSKKFTLEGHRTLGSPESFAEYYYNNGANGLIYFDTVANLYDRNSILDLKKTAEEIFIPLTVGERIQSIEDIRKALRAGADKVAINTAAVNNPDLIREASEEFGSSTIIVSIEAIQQSDGSHKLFCENGREPTGRDAVEWANKAEQKGSGEILLTSVDREGRGEGYGIYLTQQISNELSIPVIACGGAGCPEHVYDAIETGCADAVSIESMLHYQLAQKRREKEIAKVKQREEGNLHFLKKEEPPEFIETTELPDLKQYLSEQGVNARQAGANMSSTDIAIIDHGLGNLFSVKQACDYAGMDATISRDHEEIRAANGIILPGVGAFGRAMDSLSELQLDDVIQDVVDSGEPLVGICLGAQLILSETVEFGTHTVLDLIPGKVRRLDTSIDVGDNKLPYGASKVAVEHYMRVYNEVYGLLTVSLRYFTVYGIECGQTWR